jgi:O-antigen ligase
MFLTPHSNPTKATHVVYLCLTTVLGVLLSLLVHAAIEAAYLRDAEAKETAIHWSFGCALHPALQLGLLLAGAVGGFFLGRYWWRMVYVERRWDRTRPG